MSDNTNSTEINSTAETTNQMVRKAKKSIISLFGIALVLAIALVYYNFGSFFANQIHSGEMFFLGIVIITISTFISGIVLLVKYLVYKHDQSCANGKGEIFSKWHRVILCVIVILGLLLALLGSFIQRRGDVHHPLRQFEHPINFPLLSQISPQENNIQRGGTWQKKRFVAPNILYVSQHRGHIYSDDRVGYFVRYHEMRNEWFAVLFERELRRNATRYTPKDIYVSGFDSAQYFSHWGEVFGVPTYFENVILRHKNIIIIATYNGSASLFDNLYQFSLALNCDM